MNLESNIRANIMWIFFGPNWCKQSKNGINTQVISNSSYLLTRIILHQIEMEGLSSSRFPVQVFQIGLSHTKANSQRQKYQMHLCSFKGQMLLWQKLQHWHKAKQTFHVCDTSSYKAILLQLRSCVMETSIYSLSLFHLKLL